MKLVDEKLKEIFVSCEVTDIIKAYSYLVNSGCYSRIESISNALYYFDKNTIKEYDMVIIREYRNSESRSLEFYKLIDEPHIYDYLEYCIKNSKLDIHKDAYNQLITIEELNKVDSDYLLTEFDGIIHNIRENRNKSHSIIDGVIHDGDMETMDEAEEVMMEPMGVENIREDRVMRVEDEMIGGEMIGNDDGDAIREYDEPTAINVRDIFGGNAVNENFSVRANEGGTVENTYRDNLLSRIDQLRNCIRITEDYVRIYGDADGTYQQTISDLNMQISEIRGRI